MNGNADNVKEQMFSVHKSRRHYMKNYEIYVLLYSVFFLWEIF